MREMALLNLAAVAVTGLALLLVLLVLHLQERAATRYLIHRWGFRAVLLTGWLGVALHELSHLLTARLFGHRIIAWKLFDPDPVSGTLGYVRHAQSKRSLWQTLGGFFIGIAPIISGGLALAAILCWMVSPKQLLELLRGLGHTTLAESAQDWLLLGQQLAKLAEQLLRASWSERTPWLPLQLYLAICFACHLAPSRADLASALPGALVCLIAGGVLVTLAAYCGVSTAPIVGLIAPLLVLLALVALFQLGYVMLVGIVERIRSR
jgi:hypothetical protein